MSELGGPDVLRVQNWTVPPPAADEVRVRVLAAGISFADLLIMQGVHQERRTPPFVPGWDVVGEVERLGADVVGVGVGDRVAGLSVVGGWASHANLRADWVVPVPESIDATTAVCLVMDYVVAHQMLHRAAHVQRGDTVLIQGAGGGVGTALLQLAAAMGVRALGTDRESKRAHIEGLRGTLIDFETEDVVARCRELTDGRGVDAAFDGIGATALSSLRAVRRGGTLVWFGMVTALSHGRRDLSRMARTAATVVAALSSNVVPGGKRARFYSIQQLARKHPEWYRSDLTDLVNMRSRHEIDPEVAAVWKLDEVPIAVAGLAKGALPGKQVIAVGAS